MHSLKIYYFVNSVDLLERQSYWSLRSPLTVKLCPTSFFTRHIRMISSAHRAYQTVTFWGFKGYSSIACGLTSFQKRQFYLLTYPLNQIEASSLNKAGSAQIRDRRESNNYFADKFAWFANVASKSVCSL